MGKGRLYKKVELVGSSSVSIEDAIESAIERAQKTLHNLDWFEVKEIRGWIKDNGKIGHYQVTTKVGFRLDEDEDEDEDDD
jgi:flavin-binding protein dodecin